jgi:hypothetical protein
VFPTQRDFFKGDFFSLQSRIPESRKKHTNGKDTAGNACEEEPSAQEEKETHKEKKWEYDPQKEHSQSGKKYQKEKYDAEKDDEEADDGSDHPGDDIGDRRIEGENRVKSHPLTKGDIPMPRRKKRPEESENIPLPFDKKDTIRPSPKQAPKTSSIMPRNEIDFHMCVASIVQRKRGTENMEVR